MLHNNIITVPLILTYTMYSHNCKIFNFFVMICNGETNFSCVVHYEDLISAACYSNWIRCAGIFCGEVTLKWSCKRETPVIYLELSNLRVYIFQNEIWCSCFIPYLSTKTKFTLHNLLRFILIPITLTQNTNVK